MFASIRGNIQLLFEMFYLQLPFSYYKKKNKKNDENSIKKKKYNISQCVDSIIKLRILSPKHLTQMFYSTHSELPIICSALCTGTKVVQCMWLWVSMLQCVLVLLPVCGFSKRFHDMVFSYGFYWLHSELFKFCSKVCHLIKTSTESGQVIEICLFLYLDH